MVGSSCIVATLRTYKVFMPQNYRQCCTQLLKMLHCNTDVIQVLLIYLYSPSSDVCPWESCVYISQTSHCHVIIYYMFYKTINFIIQSGDTKLPNVSKFIIVNVS